MKQGDIVMIPFPFTDLSSAKVRPALVVSNQSMSGKNIFVCGITSQKSQKKAIPLINSDLIKGALPTESFVAIDYLATIKKTLIQYKVAELKPAIIKKVIDHLIKLVK